MAKTSLQKAISKASSQSGRDFSGVSDFKELGAAIANKKKPSPKDSGITLPDADLPNLGGGQISSEMDINSLISSSFAAVDTDDIKRQVKREKGISADRIRSAYGGKIEELEEQSAEHVSALEGQLGTRRRFSSSAQAFIGDVKDRTEKKIQEYETAMESALLTNDLEFANMLQKRISTERDEARQRVDDIFKALELHEKLTQYQQEKNKPATELAIYDLMEKGITEAGAIQESLSAAGLNIELEQIADTMEILASDDEEGSGLAKVVFENPSLFGKLTNSKLSEIIPELHDMGFDFQSAMTKLAEKTISESVDTTTSTMTFEEYKNSDDAIQTLETMASRGMPIQEEGLREQVLRERYDRLVASGELTETKTVPDKTKNYTATNIPNTVKSDLIADMNKPGVTMFQIIDEYPDVSDSYIRSLYKEFERQSESSSSSTTESQFKTQEEFIEFLRGN